MATPSHKHGLFDIASGRGGREGAGEGGGACQSRPVWGEREGEEGGSDLKVATKPRETRTTPQLAKALRSSPPGN